MFNSCLCNYEVDGTTNSKTFGPALSVHISSVNIGVRAFKRKQGKSEQSGLNLPVFFLIPDSLQNFSKNEIRHCNITVSLNKVFNRSVT